MGHWALGFVVLWLALWVVDSGLVLNWFRPELDREVVGRIGEESRYISRDLNGKIGLVQERLRQLVGDGTQIKDCGARESVWELNQVIYSFVTLILLSAIHLLKC